jgi:hypothetical protein
MTTLYGAETYFSKEDTVERCRDLDCCAEENEVVTNCYFKQCSASEGYPDASSVGAASCIAENCQDATDAVNVCEKAVDCESSGEADEFPMCSCSKSVQYGADACEARNDCGELEDEEAANICRWQNCETEATETYSCILADENCVGNNFLLFLWFYNSVFFSPF